MLELPTVLTSQLRLRDHLVFSNCYIYLFTLNTVFVPKTIFILFFKTHFSRLCRCASHQDCPTISWVMIKTCNLYILYVAPYMSSLHHSSFNMGDWYLVYCFAPLQPLLWQIKLFVLAVNFCEICSGVVIIFVIYTF